MPARVETDTMIYVPGSTPGTEGGEPAELELRFPLDGPKIVIQSGRYGSEVAISDLREALDRAEEVQRAEGLI